MSWAEVKKINSDLSTPLNILATIQHIDMVGENYVGYGDVKGTVEILASDALYNHMIAKTVLGGVVASQNAVALAVIANDMALKKCLSDSVVGVLATQNSIITAHFETKLSASTGVGEWLAFFADIDNTALTACADMTAVAASETAMNAVVASTTAMVAVIASSTAMTAVIASSTAMTAVAASETAMTSVAASETAVNAILNSPTAITALDNSSPTSIPTMTGEITPSGKATATSAYTTYYAWKAFDKDVESNCYGDNISTGWWCKYEFANPIWIYRLKLLTGSGATAVGVNGFKVQVSTDDSTWVDITDEIKSANVAQSPIDFSGNAIPVTGKYKYVRVLLTTLTGVSGCGIKELNVWGK